jgi:histidinol-phosphate/aromatic aminotransferase/cobyric acid decarboxylase-like protein
VAETRDLRAALAAGLRSLGWDPVPGVANFLLCRLPGDGPDAATWTAAAAARGVFLRNASAMGASLDPRWIRVAVKDAATQERMLGTLRELRAGEGTGS